MKILTITEGYPPEAGGGSTYAYEIPKRLAKKGVKTLIITGKPFGKYEDEKSDNVSVTRLNVPAYGKAGFSFNPKRFKFIFESIRTGRALKGHYDVYHFHSGMASKIVAWTLRNIYGVKKPFVMTFLGTFVGYYKELHPFPISTMMNFASRKLMTGSKCDLYVVVDDGTHADEVLYRNGVPKEKVKKHYQTVDLRKFRPKKRKRGKEKTIGYIGRMDPMKGVDIFIRSLPKILENTKNTKVVMIGSGPLLGDMKKLVKDLGIESKVEFMGQVPHNEIPKHMNMFDCLVFTDIRSFNNRDLMSLTHCEAMACGTLMVNSAKPREEWNAQTWIELENPDPEEISKKVIDALKNPGKYSKIRKNARKVAVKHFNWNDVIKIYDEEISKLV